MSRGQTKLFLLFAYLGLVAFVAAIVWAVTTLSAEAVMEACSYPRSQFERDVCGYFGPSEPTPSPESEDPK